MRIFLISLIVCAALLVYTSPYNEYEWMHEYSQFDTAQIPCHPNAGITIITFAAMGFMALMAYAFIALKSLSKKGIVITLILTLLLSSISSYKLVFNVPEECIET